MPRLLPQTLTPRALCKEFDKHIIGQEAAKRCLAIALRNRERRENVDPSIRKEIVPSNICMIGPTGSGKTALARIMAIYAGVPFAKVNANHFTEHGYVGDDVKQMVHQLVENAVDIVKKEEEEITRDRIIEAVHMDLLNALLPVASQSSNDAAQKDAHLNEKTRKLFLKKIINGEFDNREIEITLREARDGIGFFGGFSDESMVSLSKLNSVISRMMPTKTKRRRLRISEAKEILYNEKLDKHFSEIDINSKAKQYAERGIIFLDEIDKIISSSKPQHGPDVSRSGVQRNLLPIIEGTKIQTKVGWVATDGILFIAAGAFHENKPGDLLPELQGRLPIHTTLQNLTTADYATIIKKIRIKRYQALLATEGITLNVTDDGINAIAEATQRLNRSQANTGARRLDTIMEALLQEINYDTPDKITPGSTITIDRPYVEQHLEQLLAENTLRDYVI